MKITEKLYSLERRLSYQFKNRLLLQQAVTHKSASFNNNERLEFLGDSILNFIIAEILYRKFDSATEGQLTRARASLVKKETLAQLANEFSLGDYLQLGIGEQRSGGFRRDSILADALEALVGAIYLDSNFEETLNCLEKWFDSRLQMINPKEQEKDPKTRLQEWLQANQKSLPQYQVVSVVGESHCQIFTVSCVVESLSISVEGCGVSRRLAEQQAAGKVLEFINHE